MNSLLNEHPFAQAAERVRRRVLVRRWLGLLKTVARWQAFGLLVMALFVAVSGQLVWAWLALFLLMAWLGGSLFWIHRRMPGDYSVWALWDESTGRREAFAAAWWFESQAEELTAAERAHWETQRALLPAALPQLVLDLPLPQAKWMVAPLTALLALWLTAWFLPGKATDPVLTEAMHDVAIEQARRLMDEGTKNEALSALDESDREKLGDLVAAAAKDLEESGKKSVRQVMDGLEQQAREAEKLAARLGSEGDTWASPELTAALRQQADTADLGDAVADRKATETASAAEGLAGQLDASLELAELAERLLGVLTDSAAAAQKEDAERLVGGPVLKAAEKMKARDAVGAAGVMRQLAAAMREVAQREQAQAELQRLAESLREAGAKVANTGAENAMQALAGGGEQSQSKAAGQDGKNNPIPQVAQQTGDGQAQSQQMMMAPPGLDQPQQGAGESSAGQLGQAGNQQPMLGMAEAGQQGQSPPGQGDGQDKPRLLAPVPGQPQGKPEGPPILMPGQSGEPGVSLQMAGSGLLPGSGTAELKGEETSAQESARKALVNAQTQNEGASTVRQVQGAAPGEEKSGRGPSALAVEFIEAEEQALDETALPMARREQVRRYFNELRRRLEKDP